MRRRIQPVEFSHKEPPEELLRFVSSDPRHWDADEFASFLRARAGWRDTHDEHLPSLQTKERVAMQRMALPVSLVEP